MLGFKKYTIADYERGLLFRQNQFIRVMPPGRYRYFDPLNSVRIEIYDTTEIEFQNPRAKFLLRTYPVLAEEYFDSYELQDEEIGLLYVDRKLSDVVAPGSFKAYWKSLAEVRLEKLKLSESDEVPGPVMTLLMKRPQFLEKNVSQNAVYFYDVPDRNVGLLYVDGRFVRLLQPGQYGFWRFDRTVLVRLVDLRLQTLEVGGQEILSRDRVSLRVNLSCCYEVRDPEKAVSAVADFIRQLYQDLQLMLRRAVGTRTLDQLLEDKDALNGAIGSEISEKASRYGLAIAGIGVRDIILPGEMKTILNQVVEAEKAAEANLIRRREETAATRSLHNTAKVMEGNPTLLRLKELEVLEKVTERIDKITVYGGLDGVLKDLVKIPSGIGGA
jgi:regulator of protease activity HflC (stomatin/prohibitin superfamily)